MKYVSFEEKVVGYTLTTLGLGLVLCLYIWDDGGG